LEDKGRFRLQLQRVPGRAAICFKPLGFLANFRNMARVPPVIRASGDAAISPADGGPLTK
jgi:hypothetical protein